MSTFEPKPFGKYFLIDKLAIGGMAEIYKAKTFGVDGFEKQLAIKKILSNYSADKEFIAMLTDEAKLVVRLSHTNIVQIYDLGKVGDDYYISMEFIDGINLREFINRGKELHEPIPIPICLYIVSEICKGLDYAHGKRDEHSQPLHIVHRDISPQNILISFEGETKIVDFGIAKAAMNISQTTAGILKGKITYMSPEQALGKPVDHRTDIFSAGIILYELLTGTRLFQGETQLEVLKSIRTTQITVESLPATIPPDIRHTLAKSLSYLQKNRYETAGDFQIALTKILYSQYSDFSPKQLAGLITRWFAPELKHRQKTTQEETRIDSETRLAMNQSSQESIVHREDKNKVETAIMDTTKPEFWIKPEQLTHANDEARNLNTSETSLPIRASRSFKHKPLVLSFLILAILIGAGIFYYSSGPNKPPPTGQILVNSNPPGAQIFLDGFDTAKKTPATFDQLTLDAHYEIRLQKESYEPWNQEVLLSDSNPITLNADLKQIPSFGTLLIDSTPSGAQVTIDGQDQGKLTPATFTNLDKEKTYTIRLTKEGFQPTEKKISVTNDKPIELKLNLEKIVLGTLQVNSKPEGARIFLDGQDMGLTTPSLLSNLKFPKKYKIQISKPSYKDMARNIDLNSSETQTITIELEPIEVVVPPKAQTEKPKKIASPKAEDTPKSNTEKLERAKKENSGPLGQVRVDSVPRGASVLFNGQKSGITPIVIRSVEKNKKHMLVVSLPGYKNWSQTLDLKQNYIELNAKLKKE